MFALCRPKHQGLLQGEHPEILAQSDPPPVDLRVGDIRSQIAAEWLQIAQRSQIVSDCTIQKSDDGFL